MSSALNLIHKSLCVTLLGGFLLTAVASVSNLLLTTEASAESRVVHVPVLINPGRSYQSRPIIIDNLIAPTKRPAATPAAATQPAKPVTNTRAAIKTEK